MQVEITAEQQVKYSKLVEMSDAEYFEYRRILKAPISEHERVKQLEGFVGRYDLIRSENIVDSDEAQEVTVAPIGRRN